MPDTQFLRSFLATAIEAALEAGEVQLAHFGGDLRIDKKGTIDLVTDIDIAIEREFRAMIADGSPTTSCWARSSRRRGSAIRCRLCWVFDPIDGTTNYAHGLPIFCCSVALEIHGRGGRRRIRSEPSGIVHRRARPGAWLNGVPLRVSGAER